MARKHKIAAIVLLLIALVIVTCIAIMSSTKLESKEMHAEESSSVDESDLHDCRYDLMQNTKIDNENANAKPFNLYRNIKEEYNIEARENPECRESYQEIPDEYHDCQSEDHTSEMVWENLLISRKNRLISFNTSKDTYGEFLFVKLRSVIKSIINAKPSEERCKMHGISYEQGALICHYLKHLQLFVQKPMIAYDDALNPIGVYDIYATTIDCFTGHKLTQYHKKSKLSNSEYSYFAYLQSFVDERFDRILGTYTTSPNTDISLRSHIVYVLLDYICNFYTGAKKTLNLLQAKIDIEKRYAKGEVPNGFEQSRNYLYEDILDTVRPIHFVNNNAEIVKPSLLS